jgi:hypothetical protein
MGTIRLLSALGHMEKWQLAKQELEQMRAEALKLVRNRAESAPDLMSRPNSLLNAFRGGR